MSVYKEFYYAINEIQKASRQIWSDSADFGAPSKKADRIWNAAIDAAEYFDSVTDKREVEVYSTGTIVKLYIKTYNEWDGSMAKELWCLEYTTTRKSKDMDGFFNVTRISRQPLSKYSDN